MITFVVVLIGSALVAIIANTYWLMTGNDRYKSPYITIFNGIVLTIFFGSLLVLGLTPFIFGV